MVLDEPPAPAARDELGLATWEAPAARLLPYTNMISTSSFLVNITRSYAYRIWAPGGLATADAVRVEVGRGESESDYSCMVSLKGGIRWTMN